MTKKQPKETISCNQCGHTWELKYAGRYPMRCPHCLSTHYREPAQERKTFNCLRCGFTWKQKYLDIIPSTCGNPECRSLNWYRPKGTRKPYTWKSEETKHTGGRMKSYTAEVKT